MLNVGDHSKINAGARRRLDGEKQICGAPQVFIAATTTATATKAPLSAWFLDSRSGKESYEGHFDD